MTYVADLSICTYFGDAEADALGMRAVGWLSWDHSFPVGVVNDSIVGRLEAENDLPRVTARPIPR